MRRRRNSGILALHSSYEEAGVAFNEEDSIRSNKFVCIPNMPFLPLLFTYAYFR